jgi:hypothetical protein
MNTGALLFWQVHPEHCPLLLHVRQRGAQEQYLTGCTAYIK